jgi:hypothetical protein
MGISNKNSNAAISRATHFVVDVDLKDRSRVEVVDAVGVAVGDPFTDEDAGGCLLLLLPNVDADVGAWHPLEFPSLLGTV